MINNGIGRITMRPIFARAQFSFVATSLLNLSSLLQRLSNLSILKQVSKAVARMGVRLGRVSHSRIDTQV